jgi:hypothetical protein
MRNRLSLQRPKEKKILDSDKRNGGLKLARKNMRTCCEESADTAPPQFFIDSDGDLRRSKVVAMIQPVKSWRRQGGLWKPSTIWQGTRATVVPPPAIPHP